MFKTFVGIYSFLGLFYLMSYQFYSHSERRTLLTFLILSAVVGIFVGPSLSAKKRKKSIENVVREQEVDGEYHNDFSRVGSSEDYTHVAPKEVLPVDLAGNAIEHARVQLNEDLSVIEHPELADVEVKKDEDDSKS
ncbi:hypothetical protein A9Q84_18215 [Halobacteriovorax marinus]|uniref:Uncharacterized protein n=1 Tax=Halobacteriovorax marinus TaxID=97084 RepID=A0A1Y5F3I1_9BACT|nr:hypothetical protein A9Q84_18215 [Halobacteriovorax marinus]